MSIIKGRFLQDDTITGAKVKLSNDQYLRGRNNADSADVNILKVNTSDAIEFASVPETSADASSANGLVRKSQLEGYITSLSGSANGLCPLDASSKIASTYLPSYVDDVEEYADLASFPVTGESGKIYVAIDTKKTYRWSGSAYVEISPSEVNSVNGYTGVVTIAHADLADKGTNTHAQIDSHIASTSNPHSVTKSQVGLTNVDDVQQLPLSYLDTDGSLTANSDTKVPSQKAVKTYVDNVSASVGTKFKESITVTGTDITNGYVVLSHTPIANSVVAGIKFGGFLMEGIHYSIATANVSWIGDLATVIEAGDILNFQYIY